MGAAAPLLIAQGASALMGGAASAVEARSQREAAKYQAMQMRANAAVGDLQAKQTRLAGEEAARVAAMQGKQILGRQRAAAGAQGIEVNTGSAREIQEETVTMNARDVENIRNQAWMQAWGYETESRMGRMQARMTERMGKRQARQTLLTAGLQFGKDVADMAWSAKKYG